MNGTDGVLALCEVVLCATRPDKAGADAVAEAALGLPPGSVAERAALCSAAKRTEKASLVEEVKAGCEARLALAETFQADATPFRKYWGRWCLT